MEKGYFYWEDVPIQPERRQQMSLSSRLSEAGMAEKSAERCERNFEAEIEHLKEKFSAADNMANATQKFTKLFNLKGEQFTFLELFGFCKLEMIEIEERLTKVKTEWEAAIARKELEEKLKKVGKTEEI